VNASDNLLRSIVLSSRLAAEIYRTGDRQPDFIAVWMWSHLLVEKMTGEEHVIFDGTPRSLQEALIIDTAIHFYSRQRPHVIYLNISRETSKGRMIARRRIDDINAEEVERRLIDLKVMCCRRWNILGNIQSIILSNLMAISQLRQYSRSCSRKSLTHDSAEQLHKLEELDQSLFARPMRRALSEMRNGIQRKGACKSCASIWFNMERRNRKKRTRGAP
jgi:hypothetical protein